MTRRYQAMLGLLVILGLTACTTETAQRDAAGPCPDLRTDDQTSDFLASWTQPRRLRAETCVLPGLLAQRPVFDTRPLGEEQPLHPDRLPRNEPLPPLRLADQRLVNGYPIVHLGQIGDTDSHLFLAWRGTPESPLACLGAVAHQCEKSSQVSAEPGVRSYGRGSTREMTFEILVPPRTSVVALEIEGGPEGWQRPVALVAQLTARLEWAGPDDFARFGQDGLTVEITFLDADGNPITREAMTADW